MIFFGLFSTHLPYILVGVIYFASFAMAGFRVSEALISEESHDIQTIETGSVTAGAYSESAFSFYEVASDFAHPAPAVTPLPPIPATEIARFTPIAKAGNCLQPGQFFVRPPPTLS
jgi:hypothetical protein